MTKKTSLLFALLVLATLAVACGGGASSAPAAKTSSQPKPPAAAIAPSAALKATAESRHLPAMSPALQTLVRAQPWYADLTPATLEVVAAAQVCEKAAQVRGETKSVAGILEFAAEQAWYTDGLEEREALGLAGIFHAYGRSLTDDNAPPIGPVLSSTIRHGLFEVLQLPESGRMVVVVSSERLDLGRKALELSVAALPRVEQVVGKYPYNFLHAEVTKELPDVILGMSYNEFIFFNDKSVDEATAVHEITHSTLYGNFPLWFEEGFAHLIEGHLSGIMDTNVRDFSNQLRRVGRDTKLDLRPNRREGGIEELVERARGFLFLKAMADVRGIDTVSKMVRNLRTKTFTDQDLMRALVADGTPEEQVRMAQLVCQQVIGTTRNYCQP